MKPSPKTDRTSIEQEILALVADMVKDWDHAFSPLLTEQTCLVADLGFQSIDVVMLTSEIHQRFSPRKFPFAKLLITEGGYVDDIRISTLVDFLHSHWGESS